MNNETLAKKIVDYCYGNDKIVKKLQESPEPIRAMIYESKMIDADKLDGTEQFWDLMDEIEKIY
jgi:hypothetical protein